MPAIPHVIRRGAVYYWRRRLPAALAESRGSATLLLGLRTRDPRRARLLGCQVSALADLFLTDPMTQRLSQAQIQALFRNVFTRHLDKLEAVVARERVEPDFDAGESRRSDLVMAWVYRLLETRGSSAGVDERALAQMRDSGLSDATIAEVGGMLDAMRKNKLAVERPDRLKALVEEAGGEASPMNLALAQESFYRAMAEANLQIARRYDGIRVEGRASIEDVIRIHATTPPSKPSSPPQASVPGLGSRPITNTGDSASPASGGQVISSEMWAGKVEQASPVNGAGRGDGVESSSNNDRRQTRKNRSSASSELALSPAAHPIAILGGQLVKKNATVWDVKTQRQAAQIYGLLAKLLCENDVYEICELRQSHFAALDDLFASVAKSYGKSSKDEARTTAELRAIGASKPPAERGLAPETVNRHFTFLGQLLTFIRGRGHQLDRDIDLSLLRAKTKGRARDKRAIFRPSELDAVFGLPCFTGCAGWKGNEAFMPGPFVFHRALYFAIILLYYTGARREEICGLMVDDIGSMDQSGKNQKLDYIKIAPNEARRIKNDQSTRFVALHPEIARLGFFDYVNTIRTLGYKLVFPDLKSPGSSAPLGDRLYDEFSRGLLKAVPDARERKKVIHSLRKTFGDSLKQKGVAAEIRGDIMGHAGSTVTEEIYCDPISLGAMLDEVGKLPVVTAHLERRAISLLPWVERKDAPPHARTKNVSANA